MLHGVDDRGRRQSLWGSDGNRYVDISHIKSPAEALSMVEAGLITINDYISICVLNNWEFFADRESNETTTSIRLVWNNGEEI